MKSYTFTMKATVSVDIGAEVIMSIAAPRLARSSRVTPACDGSEAARPRRDRNAQGAADKKRKAEAERHAPPQHAPLAEFTPCRKPLAGSQADMDSQVQ
jgi:hypothetical protein